MPNFNHFIIQPSCGLDPQTSVSEATCIWSLLRNFVGPSEVGMYFKMNLCVKRVLILWNVQILNFISTDDKNILSIVWPNPRVPDKFKYKFNMELFLWEYLD